MLLGVFVSAAVGSLVVPTAPISRVAPPSLILAASNCAPGEGFGGKLDQAAPIADELAFPPMSLEVATETRLDDPLAAGHASSAFTAGLKRFSKLVPPPPPIADPPWVTAPWHEDCLLSVDLQSHIDAEGGMSGDGSDADGEECREETRCVPTVPKRPPASAPIFVARAILPAPAVPLPRSGGYEPPPASLGAADPGYPQELFEPPRAA